MKKSSRIAQWVFTGLFGICALGNGFHWSSLFLLLAAVLMAPIPAIRNWLKSIRIKNGLAITLAVVVFFVGMMGSPMSETPDNLDSGGSSYSESQIDDSNSSVTIDNNSSDTNGGTTSSKVSSTESSKDNFTNSKPTDTSKPTESSKPSSVGSGTAKPVELSSIPAYSGKAYITVNNNKPSFSSSELTTKGYEKYSKLDSLNRCGAALASCGKEIMPGADEKRGSISSIYPSGWNQAKYDGISGGWLWNRCHLIGWQLSAENANRENLITGTRYMNISGMLPIENMVADYIKETGNHVAYRVTPIYDGNNLVCSGVQMEAYSIEDKGEGIEFNVYCYNVQPGIKINYADGSSSSTSGPNNTTSSSKPTASVEQDTNKNENAASTKYVLNTSTKKFHYPTCGSAGRIATKNYAESNESRDSLIAQGYSPCGNCDP